MMPIPPTDPLGLTTQAWLAQSILCISFTFYYAFACLVIGIPILGLAHRIVSGKEAMLNAITGKLLGYYPLFLVLAITTSFLPMLMIQAVYGNLFYTSTILMGTFWLSIPLVLVVIFCLWTKHHSTIVLAMMFLLSLYVASISTNNSILLQRPDLWAEFSSGGRWLPIVRDASFAPRFAIMLITSVTVVGIAIALLGCLGNLGEGATKYGLRLALVFAVVGACLIIWYAWSLLQPGRGLFVEQREVLITGLIALLFLMGTAILGIMRPRNPAWPMAGTILLIVYLWSQARSIIATRDVLLSPYFTPLDLPSRMQIIPMIAFFVIAAISIVAIAWMIRLINFEGADEGAL